MSNNEFLIKMLPNFSETENWGDLNKMNPNILVLLQDLRTYLGKSIKINVAYELSGHSTKSQHYLGNAVDFTVSKMNFLDALNKIEERLKQLSLEDCVGFGVYPWWNTPGFHLDCRGEKARWGRLKDGSYVALDFAINEYKKQI